jgi:hypothetical protein
MKYSFLISLLVLVVISCGKDKFQSTPQLTLKSVSSTVVPANTGLQVILQLTDSEGDIGDSIWVRKLTTRCPSSNTLDSGKYRIPSDVPRTKNMDAEIIFTFDYAFDGLQPACTQPDTAIFSFWLKDLAGHVSDTASTPAIIIEK